MAEELERFGLPENLHRDLPEPRYWLSRSNRRNFFEWYADRNDLPLPLEDQAPWYGLRYDALDRPIDGARPFGRGVKDSWNRADDRLHGTWVLSIIDAFPEVDWAIWLFEGRVQNRSGLTRWSGYCLPDPEEDRISEGATLLHIDGRAICRSYILEMSEIISIGGSGIEIPSDPEQWGEDSWYGVTASLLTQHDPPIPNISSFLRNGGCPVQSSLFSGLSTHFDDVSFSWRDFLVGGRVSDGFGDPDVVGDDRAREDLQSLLRHICRQRTGYELTEDNLELLYDFGQRTISNYFGGVKGRRWRGSTRILIEFAFPVGPEGRDWDPTRFGLNSERQRAFYHRLRSEIREDELYRMDDQQERGWERRLSEFGTYPLTPTTYGNNSHFGGTRTEREEVGLSGQSISPEADIWLESRSLMVDVLGEDHFDPIARSNEMSEDQVRARFHQRWVQDRQRWQMCWNAGYHVIAVGPDLGIDSEGMQRFADSLASTLGGGPMFQALGWPDGTEPAQPPHFGLDYRIVNRNLVELGDSEE